VKRSKATDQLKRGKLQSADDRHPICKKIVLTVNLPSLKENEGLLVCHFIKEISKEMNFLFVFNNMCVVTNCTRFCHFFPSTLNIIFLKIIKIPTVSWSGG